MLPTLSLTLSLWEREQKSHTRRRSMTDPISRRDLIKGLGAIGASGLLKSAEASAPPTPEFNRPLPHVVLTPRADGEITLNDTHGDMHEGTRRLVMNLRARHPSVLCVG